MNIAVVGSGLAGLAVSYHLLQFPGTKVTIFDPSGPGGGASGVSTGLLHPFPGRLALRSWMAKEGMEETLRLVDVSEKEMGQSVSSKADILRIAVQEAQKQGFYKRSLVDSEAVWWETEEVLSHVPEAAPAPGLWIPSGVSVYSQLYLEGLWRACSKLGASLEQVAVSSLNELSAYDQIVLATGYQTLWFPECQHLPIEPVKGQVLVCKLQKELAFSLTSVGHITLTPDPTVCLIGSTYEHNFKDTDAHRSVIGELLTKASTFYPSAKDFEVLDVRAGVRVGRVKQYRPIVTKVTPKAWVFTGLGSRGMLYHALLGKKLAEAIATGASVLSPDELHRSLLA